MNPSTESFLKAQPYEWQVLIEEAIKRQAEEKGVDVEHVSIRSMQWYSNQDEMRVIVHLSVETFVEKINVDVRISK